MTTLREWRGELRRELADEYVAYIRDTGLAEYRATPGNLGALIAVRDLDDERCGGHHVELVAIDGRHPRIRRRRRRAGGVTPW